MRAAVASSRATADRALKQSPGCVLARITGARKGAIVDGIEDDATCDRLLGMVAGRRRSRAGKRRAQGVTVADYNPDHEGGASWYGIPDIKATAWHLPVDGTR